MKKYFSPPRSYKSIFTFTVIALFGGAMAYTAINYSEYFPNGSQVVQSQLNGWTTPIGWASKDVETPEGCRKITSTQWVAMLIPTRTLAEWNAFKNALPSGVSIWACANPINGVCGSGINGCFSTSTLCSIGTPTWLTGVNTGTASWTCQWSDGWNSVSCSGKVVPDNYVAGGYGFSCQPVECSSFWTYTQFTPSTWVWTQTTYSSCFTNQVRTENYSWNGTNWTFLNSNTTGGQPRVCVEVC